MRWPQILMIVLMAFGFISLCVTKIRDKDASSNQVTIYVFLMAGFYAWYAYVLHAGGFW